MKKKTEQAASPIEAKLTEREQFAQHCEDLAAVYAQLDDLNAKRTVLSAQIQEYADRNRKDLFADKKKVEENGVKVALSASTTVAVKDKKAFAWREFYEKFPLGVKMDFSASVIKKQWETDTASRKELEALGITVSEATSIKVERL